MATWNSGLRITITSDSDEVFAIHYLAADEATHFLAEVGGKEAVEQEELDMDRFGDRGAEDLMNDLVTACSNVVKAAKENNVY